MPDSRRQIVADGYDAMGETFAVWREQIVGDPRAEWEEELASRLADGARVLELGCGAGTPETRRFAQRFAVTGLHISTRQVERARAAIPGAEFVCADFTELEQPAASFDTEGWTVEWLGAETFSSFPPELNSRLVREAGFAIERDEVVTFEEPQGPACFQWVLAQA